MYQQLNSKEKILKIEPEALEILAKEAMADVSFYLRPAHLKKLSLILEDPEASDNDPCGNTT